MLVEYDVSSDLSLNHAKTDEIVRLSIDWRHKIHVYVYFHEYSCVAITIFIVIHTLFVV